MVLVDLIFYRELALCIPCIRVQTNCESVLYRSYVLQPDATEMTDRLHRSRWRLSELSLLQACLSCLLLSVSKTSQLNEERSRDSCHEHCFINLTSGKSDRSTCGDLDLL